MNEMLIFGMERAYMHAPDVLVGMLVVWLVLTLVADRSPGWRRATLVCAGTAGGLRAYNAVDMLGSSASLTQIFVVIAAMLATALLFHGSGRLIAQTVAGFRMRRRSSP